MRRVMAGAIIAACLALAGCGGGSSSAAATVNGHDISMRDFNLALQSERDKSVHSGPGYDPCAVKVAAPECDLLKRQALSSLIDKELVREYASTHRISVPQADVDRQWAVVFKAQFHSRQDVLNAFLRRLNETEADLKAAIADDLLQQKVAVAVVPAIPTHAPAVRLGVIEASTRVYAQVRGALHFKQFVTVMQDEQNDPQSGCANLKCGDIGWVPYVLVPPNRKLLTTARVGAIVGPFARQAYFELYQVEARDTHYSLTQAQQYGLRLQQFTTWLGVQQHHATVKRYIAA